MDMKIFASDYDGTLKTAQTVSQANKTAITKWRQNGNLFALVSGRSMESMRQEVLQNELEVDFFIGNNGGAIYDAQFREIKTYYIPFQKALEILAYIKRERSISFVINDGYHRAKTVLDDTREDKKYAHTKTTYSAEAILKRKQIAQIVVSLDNDEDCERIANHINGTFGDIACAYRNVNCVDIAPYGVSKATGLAYMLHHLQIQTDEVFTMGDSFNDIPMLSTFYGFAMAQATTQVKSYAKAECASVADAIAFVMAEPKETWKKL